MSNSDVEALIADALQAGFLHPGDPKRGIKPTPILLPFRPTHGMPKEMSEMMVKTAQLLAECIVSLIEQGHDIVGKDELRGLRYTAEQTPLSVLGTPVHCRCDVDFKDPLIVLTITDPARAVVDGRAVINALKGRDPKCPHAIVEVPR